MKSDTFNKKMKYGLEITDEITDSQGQMKSGINSKNGKD
jgi:hypothetical protein